MPHIQFRCVQDSVSRYWRVGEFILPFQRVTRPAEQNLLLFGLLFGRHFSSRAERRAQDEGSGVDWVSRAHVLKRGRCNNTGHKAVGK